jgi:hypothetical protein
MVDFDLVFGFIFQKAVLKSRDHISDTLHAWATICCIYPAPNIETAVQAVDSRLCSCCSWRVKPALEQTPNFDSLLTVNLVFVP